MDMIRNEFSALYRRKQFCLLSAVLFVFGLAALFLYERNTEEYYYLFQEKEGTAEWYETREAASEAAAEISADSLGLAYWLERNDIVIVSGRNLAAGKVVKASS